MQRFEVIGNLTQNVELKKIKVGDKEKTVAVLSVAENTLDKTLFINIEVWEKTAENCAKYLSKGSKVFVDIEIRNNDYEKDGKKVYGYKFLAKQVEFLTSAPQKEE